MRVRRSSLIALGLASPRGRAARRRRRRRRRDRPAPRRPIDLTGYWVSIVTQDWRWRMVTPAKGDYQGIPLTAEAQKLADAWDPAKDEAAGEQCRSYGAPAIDERPGPAAHHLAGRQHAEGRDRRRHADAALHFGDDRAPASTPATWQGVSVAQWQSPRRRTCRCIFRPAERTADAPPSPRRRIAARRHRRTCAPGTCARTACPTARTPC